METSTFVCLPRLLARLNVSLCFALLTFFPISLAEEPVQQADQTFRKHGQRHNRQQADSEAWHAALAAARRGKLRIYLVQYRSNVCFTKSH